MPLTLHDVSVVLRRYGLPSAAALRALPGGLSHETYHVRVGDPRSHRTHPAYVVKRLVAGVNRPGFLAELDRAWSIERRMWAAGVRMPRPVPDPRTGAGYVRVAGLGTFRLHEFLDGRSATGAATDPEVVTEAGALLASVHAAAQTGPPQACDLAGFGITEACRQLVAAERGRKPQLEAAIPAAEELTRSLAAERLVLRPTLTTHRDVDPKNVLLRRDGGLVLVDWDVAALADPHHELTSATLDWAGAVDRRFDATLGERFLAGYRGDGGPAGVVADGVAIWLLQYLRWFEFGLRQRAKAAGGTGVGPATLPAAAASRIVDWGCRWAPQTAEDLAAIRTWVAGQVDQPLRLVHDGDRADRAGG
ncbi:MAG TPA: aminoglycoside phosphotransferase family protein [Dermatophilaceae bacterium]|nr:aminoglycoside phosphotransferase family protein [Dermatophilaceae bacterium]